jgi:hypothetical protein
MALSHAVLILWLRPTRNVGISPLAIAAYVELRPDLVICIKSSGVTVGKESNSAIVALLMRGLSVAVCSLWLGRHRAARIKNRSKTPRGYTRGGDRHVWVCAGRSRGIIVALARGNGGIASPPNMVED